MENWKIAFAIYATMTIDFILIGLITFYAIQRRLLDKYLYYLAALFFIGQGIVLYFFTSGMEFTNTSFLFMTLLMIFMIFIVTMISRNFNLYRILNSENRSVFYSLVVFSILIVLSIVFGFGKDYWTSYFNERKPTWSGFIVNFLFFIPCMMYDFADYLTYQWTHTRMPILFLVFVEILVLVIYYFGKSWGENCLKTQLLPQPVFLKDKVVISDSQPMMIQNVVTNTVNPESENTFNIQKDYAFTMWVYINDYTTNSDNLTVDYRLAKNVFLYGESNGTRGNPRVCYYNRNLLFYFSTNPVSSNPSPDFIFNILMQKWNHVAINYKNNEVDVFMNGTLVHSHSLKENLPIYEISNAVVVGEKFGVDGAICNIHYHREPLTRIEIAYEYNTLSLSNPPLP